MTPPPAARLDRARATQLLVRFVEPVLIGLVVAAAALRTTREAGAVVLAQRRGSGGGDVTREALLVLAALVVVIGGLLWFRRTRRDAFGWIAPLATIGLLFAKGYRQELAGGSAGAFFGLSTLVPRQGFVEDYPARPKVHYDVNGFGLRGPDWAEKKADGTARVAVIGDSFVFGSGVEYDDTLPRRLSTELATRFPDRRVEVLNLGVPGNNLVSHFRMLRVAEQSLGADVLVLCLTLPNDLSEWDGQEERSSRHRVGAFSLASYLLGYSTAITLWGERTLARSITDEGLALLDREAARYAAERRGRPAAPLVVFTYAVDDPHVTERVAKIPGAVIVPAVEPDLALVIPNDGHPNARGNQEFAALVAEAFDAGWLAR